MASSYSSNLRLEKMATGEKSGTWGDIVNTQFELLEDAISGYVSVAMGDANTTLTASNGAADESRNLVVECTGAHTASRDLIIPAAEKVYIVKNSTTGGYSIVVKVSGQTGATVPNGESRLLFCNGTTTYSAGNFLSQTTDNAFTAQQTITLSSATAVPLELVSTRDDALIGPVLSLYRNNSAGEASSDIIGGLYFYGTDGANNKELFAAVKVTMDDVTSTSEDGSLAIGVITAGTFAYELNLTGAALSPVASGGLTLGTATLPFGNAFLGSGTKLDFNNGNYTVTHSAGNLAFSGTASFADDITLSGANPTITLTDTDTGSDASISGSSATGSLVISADTGNEVASSQIVFQVDGTEVFNINSAGNFNFPVSGTVLNFGGSDVTITHSANTLTVAGGSVTFSGGMFVSAGQTATFQGDVTLGNDTGDTVIIHGRTLTPAITATWDASTLANHTDELLDALGTETEGALIYHNGTSWVVLAPP